MEAVQEVCFQTCRSVKECMPRPIQELWDSQQVLFSQYVGELVLMTEQKSVVSLFEASQLVLTIIMNTGLALQIG